MKLCALELQNFRNIAMAELVPAQQTTFVVGPNGQGKTNLLEALYVLATLRPLRTSRFAELIRFGESHARVEGCFEVSGAERCIALDISTESRTAFVDGKRAQNFADYFGGLSVVAFTPDDLAIVKGAPEGRRRFLDRAVFNRFPRHLDASRTYLRALKQRNHLLRTRAERPLLESFDHALVQAGTEVISRRLAFVCEMRARLWKSFEAIAPGDGGCTLRYAPFGSSFSTPEADALQGTHMNRIAEAFHRALVDRVARDLDKGFTSVGPHCDEIEFRIGERLARTFASQGQQRAVVLAFKIAELENLRERIGVPPLLLLDDVSSELDPARNRFLMDYLRHASLQCILTTTDERLVTMAAGEGTKCFFVEKGRFRAQEKGESRLDSSSVRSLPTSRPTQGGEQEDENTTK